MARISDKDTKPEILVRKYLFQKGFRYRKNVKDLPGKPDIVLHKYKIIILLMDVSGMVICVRQANFLKRTILSGKTK